LVVLQTDDLLKLRFTTVAERQDACLELRKNFDGQEFELRLKHCITRWRHVPISLVLVRSCRRLCGPKLRSDKPA
jgi:hypothetical protein